MRRLALSKRLFYSAVREIRLSEWARIFTKISNVLKRYLMTEALGFSIRDIAFNNKEELDKTENTQPAILTMSIAALRI